MAYNLVWSPTALTASSIQLVSDEDGGGKYFCFRLRINFSDVQNLETFAGVVSAGNALGIFSLENGSIVTGNSYAVGSDFTSLTFDSEHLYITSDVSFSNFMFNFAYNDSGLTMPVRFGGIFGKTAFKVVLPFPVVTTYHADAAPASTFTFRYNGTDVTSIPTGGWTQTIQYYSNPSFILNPFVVTDSGNCVLELSRTYNANFTNPFGVSQLMSSHNPYDGASNWYAAPGLDQFAYDEQIVALTNESNVDTTTYNATTPSEDFPIVTEGNIGVRYFNKNGYSYILSQAGLRLAAPPDVEVSPGIYGFNSTIIDCMMTTDTVLYLYLYSQSATINHMVVYSISEGIWNVATPIATPAQYSDLSSNGTGVDGTWQLFTIDISLTSNLTLGIIPNGYQLINSQDSTLQAAATGGGSGIKMVYNSHSVDGTFDLTAIDNGSTFAPLCTNNIDICLAGNPIGAMKCGYLPNSSHFNYNPVIGTYRSSFGDIPVMLGVLYNVEDLEFGGVNGFASGYSDFDFNDLCLYVTTSNIGASYNPISIGNVPTS